MKLVFCCLTLTIGLSLSVQAADLEAPDSLAQQTVSEPEESLEPESVQTEVEKSVSSDDTGQVPPFPPRSHFEEILQRPLFYSSRRPQADASGSGGSAQELRETWKLTGIVIVGDELRALFQERNGERRQTLGAGMPLDANWVLDKINVETVIMDSGDEQVTLELLEPRDTTPVETPDESGEDESDEEPGSVDERTRAASRQLEEDAESVKETPDE